MCDCGETRVGEIIAGVTRGYGAGSPSPHVCCGGICKATEPGESNSPVPVVKLTGSSASFFSTRPLGVGTPVEYAGQRMRVTGCATDMNVDDYGNIFHGYRIEAAGE